MSRLAFYIGLFIASGLLSSGFAFAQPAPTTSQFQDFQYYNPNATEPAWWIEPSITAGISYLTFDHAKNDAFYTRTGAYIDGNADLHLPDLHLPVLFGAGVTASGFWDSDSFLGVDALYSNVNFVAVEGRISWPIPLFDWQDGGPFLMPRIGVGGLFDNYIYQTPFNGNVYHNGGAVEVRPSIEFGYRWESAAVGVEISYMYAWGSFGDFGSHAQECRGGFTFSYRY